MISGSPGRFSLSHLGIDIAPFRGTKHVSQITLFGFGGQSLTFGGHTTPRTPCHAMPPSRSSLLVFHHNRPPCPQNRLPPRIPPPTESLTDHTLESGISLTSSTSYRPSSPSHTLSTRIAIFCKGGKHRGTDGPRQAPGSPSLSLSSSPCTHAPSSTGPNFPSSSVRSVHFLPPVILGITDLQGLNYTSSHPNLPRANPF